MSQLQSENLTPKKKGFAHALVFPLFHVVHVRIGADADADATPQQKTLPE